MKTKHPGMVAHWREQRRTSMIVWQGELLFMAMKFSINTFCICFNCLICVRSNLVFSLNCNCVPPASELKEKRQQRANQWKTTNSLLSDLYVHSTSLFNIEKYKYWNKGLGWLEYKFMAFSWNFISVLDQNYNSYLHI